MIEKKVASYVSDPDLRKKIFKDIINSPIDYMDKFDHQPDIPLVETVFAAFLQGLHIGITRSADMHLKTLDFGSEYGNHW